MPRLPIAPALAVLALALPHALPQPAAAQALPCAQRERVLEFVIDRQGEIRLATGIAGRGAEMELYAGAEGNWTLVLHLPDGRSCILANGTGFQATGGLQPARGRPA